jgi:hypothetical protein
MGKRRAWARMATALAVGAALLMGPGAGPASAQTITVTSTLEAPGAAGDCTLGEAIQAAQTNAAVDACPAGTGSDQIVLAAGATYTLTEAVAPNDLSAFRVQSTIAIQGDGASLVRQPAIYSLRFFTVTATGRLTLIDLTLRDGRAVGLTGTASVDPMQPGGPGHPGQGGALYVQPGGELALDGVTFAGNQALGGRGGAGFPVTASPGGPAGPGEGGALYNRGLVLLQGDGATFMGNKAIGGTGGNGGTVVAAAGFGGPALGGAILSRGEVQDEGGRLVADGNEARGGNGGSSGGGGQGGEAAGGAWYGSAGFNERAFVGAVFANNLAQGGAPGAGVVFTDDRLGGQAAGGGLHYDGMLTLIDSRITGNTAAGGGGDGGGQAVAGGLYAVGELTLRRTVVAGNTAVGGEGSAANRLGGRARGGGLFVTSPTLVLEQAAVAGNAALAGSNPATTTLAAAQGGGMYLFGNSGVMTNTTIALNAAREFGGVWSGMLDLTLTHVTVANNTAETTGGLAAPPVAGVEITLRNSVAAHNAGGNCAGTILAASVNLQFPGTGCGGAVEADPRLGAVGDHGGQTLTAALLPGSPAVNAAAAQFCPDVDQRGRPRPAGEACDLGAYEYWADLWLPAVRGP